jgi:protein TonB
MKNKKSLYIALVLSLLAHGLIAIGLAVFHPDDSALNNLLAKQLSPSEVQLLTPDELLKSLPQTKQLQQPDPQAQIVEQSEKQLNDETPENARFLSRNNQKVVRETQAKLNGQFKNSESADETPSKDDREGSKSETLKAATKTPSSPEQSQTADPEESLKEPLTSSDGISISKNGRSSQILKDFTPSFMPKAPKPNEDAPTGGGKGPSATDDHLKNVALGMQTLLSTREFVYYSYYNRIKDKLRQYWEPKIKEKMERIMRQGRTVASTGDKITRMIIILDENGTLQKVQVISPSGVQDLDEAAVEAFRAAAPFPNPPQGIVEPDGTIKIRWDFILEANASGLFKTRLFSGKSSRDQIM